ncbi:MAG: amidohydrolase family protein, partial [Turicibacter sp.]
MDMIIKNILVYQTFTQQFEMKDVLIENGRFSRIADQLSITHEEVMDGTGKWMIPGLIDIHMHIESSMTLPSRFSQAVLPHGVTTVVADPHEIANVFGLEGIQSFLSNATALDIFYGIPS